MVLFEDVRSRLDLSPIQGKGVLEAQILSGLTLLELQQSISQFEDKFILDALFGTEYIKDDESEYYDEEDVKDFSSDEEIEKLMQEKVAAGEFFSTDDYTFGGLPKVNENLGEKDGKVTIESYIKALTISELRDMINGELPFELWAEAKEELNARGYKDDTL